MSAPMGSVIDASVTLRWLLEGEPDIRATEVMESLDEQFALVPVLWHFEVAHGLRNAARVGILSPEAIAALSRGLELLDIRTDAMAPQVQRLGLEAISTGLTAYDVSYLLLARDHALPLATFNAELAEAARSAGVELVFEAP